MVAIQGRRYIIPGLILAALAVVLLSTDRSHVVIREQVDKFKQYQQGKKDPAKEAKPPGPKYLPAPEYVPPPVVDPFISLATSPPPSIPRWNVPEKNLHKKYQLPYAPPLFIGFTRGWPLLVQAVVSYITAGWPASQIYVIENTGTQWANPRGRLSLQNPFYLNHNSLKSLGVNIIQTPVLLNFAQLQNFYMHLSQEREWPYYFWSHMDVIVSSHEGGHNGQPKAGEAGYKTIYESCLAELNAALHSGERWGTRFFAYDHLTLVNRAAYEDVGGWDTYIPYYITDCDMHQRLLMHNWTLDARDVGVISDVNTVLKDLRALYREPAAELDYRDPNPPEKTAPGAAEQDGKGSRDGEPAREGGEPEHVEYWRRLQAVVDRMVEYKKGDRGRNTWQSSQRGGEGEPFYYSSRGVQRAFDMLTAVGGQIYEEKWGHKDCALIEGGRLKLEDQWRVAHDWD
ncbi:hypothetical protein H633G_10997 [Metarhizium anisopliae BRIP 53284]|nr:hypothetical protein H633G_10997 [Metarhizium anisopliae BRIP 53284]